LAIGASSKPVAQRIRPEEALEKARIWLNAA
jgi:hypothetical protein